MRILVAGAGGQLGHTLVEEADDAWQVTALERSELDLTNARAVAAAIRDLAPQTVINCAAYTAVDRAEADPQRARAVNALGAGQLAASCAEAGARLVQISTDYVFDGAGEEPYPPGHPVHPVNVYGASKAEGERLAAHALGDRLLIIRTAWIYSAGGQGFFGAVLRRLREGQQLRVVDDQIGTPTAARPLARAVLEACRRTPSGILHWTDAGMASRYQFAVAIAEEAQAAGLLGELPSIHPVATVEESGRARRPRYGVLETASSVAALALSPRPWRTELRRVIAERQSA